MRSFLARIALLIAVALPAAHASSPSESAFERMKALAGTWKATTASGHGFSITFRLVASDSALVETYTTASGRETLTIYHLDGERLIATHYCAQRNQPRLRLDPTGAGDAIVFTFLDATNLSSPEASHLVRLQFTIVDRDHVTENETYSSGGKDDVSAYSLVREK